MGRYTENEKTGRSIKKTFGSSVRLIVLKKSMIEHDGAPVELIGFAGEGGMGDMKIPAHTISSTDTDAESSESFRRIVEENATGRVV